MLGLGFKTVSTALLSFPEECRPACSLPLTQHVGKAWGPHDIELPMEVECGLKLGHYLREK